MKQQHEKVVYVNKTKDVDIRDHAIIIKFDRGHEEVKTESQELGQNTYDDNIRLVIQKDKNDKIVRIKIQNV